MLRPLKAVISGWAPSRTGRSEPLSLIAAAWPSLVGERVAAHATPLALNGKTLVIATRSSAWSQQLQLLSPEILTGLTGLPEAAVVERLSFRSGALRARRERSPGRARAAAPYQAELPEGPAADGAAALERLRRRLTRLRRAARATCAGCGAPVEPGKATCAPCATAAESERVLAAQRLLFAAPWLTHDELRQHVRGLTRNEYDRTRADLLARWWAILERARRLRRTSAERLEHQIASSYVLLQSGLAPDRITKAVLRNALGDELEALLWGGDAADVQHARASK